MNKDVSDPKERGGLTTEDKTGCEQEGIESYGQKEPALGFIKFDTVREQITLRPSGSTVSILPLDEKPGASVQ